jgi:hypothetical protein
MPARAVVIMDSAPKDRESPFEDVIRVLKQRHKALNMSHEGLTLVMRAALTIFLIIVGHSSACWWDRVGSAARSCQPARSAECRRRACRLSTAPTTVDASAIFACLGMPLGWSVSRDSPDGFLVRRGPLPEHQALGRTPTIGMDSQITAPMRIFPR